MQLTEQTLSTGLTRVDALLLAVLKSVICASDRLVPLCVVVLGHT